MTLRVLYAVIYLQIPCHEVQRHLLAVIKNWFGAHLWFLMKIYRSGMFLIHANLRLYKICSCVRSWGLPSTESHFKFISAWLLTLLAHLRIIYSAGRIFFFIAFFLRLRCVKWSNNKKKLEYYPMSMAEDFYIWYIRIIIMFRKIHPRKPYSKCW